MKLWSMRLFKYWICDPEVPISSLLDGFAFSGPSNPLVSAGEPPTSWDFKLVSVQFAIFVCLL